MPTNNRERNERFTSLISEISRRKNIIECETSLLAFIRRFWHVLEPGKKLVEGWALEAMCQHLEAVTDGRIKRLLINVPPGSMKSLCVNVFWPAWEWARGMAGNRYVTFSYAAHLTQRDNLRFRTLVASPEYQAMFGDRFRLEKIGEFQVSNDKMGWKIASSVDGVSTGERGDRVILDDPHNVKQGESKIIRTKTVEWFSNAMSNRLNDLEKSVIVVVMQRIHEDDVSGRILSEDLGYTCLVIPAEYDEGRHCTTSIGWTDPRSVPLDNFWPERFPPLELTRLKTTMSPTEFASQYQQMPMPKGGAIFQQDWWDYQLPYPTKGGGTRFTPPGISFDYIVAALDTAYTVKEQNDFSALTVWGTYIDQDDEPRIMLIDAWRKRLEIHGGGTLDAPKDIIRIKDDYFLSQRDDELPTKMRPSQAWGLTEWVAYTCRLRRVDRLLIESRTQGYAVAQELARLYGREGFSIDLINPRGDKVARAHSIVPLFSDNRIQVPAVAEDDNLYPMDFAEMLISEAAYFPRGAHDDLVDSMVMALRHMRDYGLAVRREEHQFEVEEGLKYRPKAQPLYPC